MLEGRSDKVEVMHGEPGEKDLIGKCLAGDERAWDVLFDAHYNAALCFVFQLSSDITHEDAEEIAQEAFTSFVRGLGSFRGGSSVRTWLFRIAANKAHDFLDHRAAAKRGGGAVTMRLGAGDAEGLPGVDPPAPGRGPSEELEARDEAGRVHAALARLNAACREIIELRYFGDLSYEEIAATLKLNAKTVSSRLSRCVHELGSLFGDFEDEGGGTEAFPSKNPGH